MGTTWGRAMDKEMSESESDANLGQYQSKKSHECLEHLILTKGASRRPLAVHAKARLTNLD